METFTKSIVWDPNWEDFRLSFGSRLSKILYQAHFVFLASEFWMKIQTSKSFNEPRMTVVKRNWIFSTALWQVSFHKYLHFGVLNKTTTNCPLDVLCKVEPRKVFQQEEQMYPLLLVVFSAWGGMRTGRVCKFGQPTFQWWLKASWECMHAYKEFSILLSLWLLRLTTASTTIFSVFLPALAECSAGWAFVPLKLLHFYPEMHRQHAVVELNVNSVPVPMQRKNWVMQFVQQAWNLFMESF